MEIEGISVEIVRKRMKYVRVYVLPPNGAVRVSAPMRMGDAAIRAFLAEKLSWIQKHRQKYAMRAPVREMQYATGEELLVFGCKYPLMVKAAGGNEKCGVFFDISMGEKIVLLVVQPNADRAARAKMAERWYRALLSEAISDRLPKWEQASGLKCSSWHIRVMKKCWGTCQTVTHKICFALRLAEKPFECLDYVIAHELGHIAVPNHGEKFKQYMYRCYPEWKAVKKRLNSD